MGFRLLELCQFNHYNINFKVHQILPFCFIAYPSPLLKVCCEPIPTIRTVRGSHPLCPKLIVHYQKKWS